MNGDDELRQEGLVLATGPSSFPGSPIPVTEFRAEQIHEWQQTRRKPEGHFNLPVRGFGESGQYTLWLPSPLPSSRVVFRDGKPTVENSPGVLDFPEISALRDKILESFAITGPEGHLVRFTVDIALLEYSAAVIGINYRVTDEDLTFLHQGDKWIAPMVEHAVGGPKGIDRLRVVAAQALGGAPMPPEDRIAPQNRSVTRKRASGKDRKPPIKPKTRRKG